MINMDNMKWLYYLLFLQIGIHISAQEIIMPESIQDSLIRQDLFFPQEKIHIHTDRTLYVPGERILFKAYIVDAVSHRSPTYSQYAYIELINSSDSLMQRVMVSRDSIGLFHGNIFLSEFIPEGDYTLRGYTRYMENQGDDYFFKRPVRISNLKTRSEIRQPQRQPRDNFEVSFFPEGGQMTEGAMCRIAFKVLKMNGISESVTGEIVDSDGNLFCKVNTVFAGMGSFYLTPEAGKEYYFVCKNSNGVEKRFKLPPAQNTCVISTNFWHNRHIIRIIKSIGLKEKPLYLLVHCRGILIYFAAWNHHSDYITLRTDQLPSGVIQVVLFDEWMNPVSERLIFNKNNDQATLVLNADKPSYQKREKISSEIYVTDREGNPLMGHVSVAVTDDRDVVVDTLYNINSSLLLSSELRGYIESPGYYLQDHLYAEYALDHLMMTHGWRRYEISEAIRGNYIFPETGFEITKELSGTVKSVLSGRPVINREVSFISNDGNFGVTTTDSTGKFRFDLHYPDSTMFFVQVNNAMGRLNVELALNREKFPKLRHAPVSISLLPADTEPESRSTDNIIDFIKKAEQRAQYDENMRVVYLDEIVVTAKRIDERDEVRLQYWFNLNTDHTIYREDIENRGAIFVTDLLWGVGMIVGSNGRIYFRGIGTIFSSTDPLVLIDGVEMKWPEDMSNVSESPLETVNVFDVESIDVIRPGPNTSIFGVRGSNGVISITTKRGSTSSNSVGFSGNQASINPLGYQKPIEYYAPKYDTPEAKSNGVPDYRTTIFWKPDVIVSDVGKASFDFYASDFPTTYSVVIEGISYDGNIIRQVETIEVR